MIEKIKIIIKYILKREGDSNRLREDTAPENSDDSFFSVWVFFHECS